MLAAEVDEASAIAANVFGYQALELCANSTDHSLLCGAQVFSHHQLLCRTDGISEPIRAEYTRLPFCNEATQLIAVRHLPHLVEDWPTLLSEAERILAPGGIFLMCCLSRRTLRRSGLAKSGWNPVSLTNVRVQLEQQQLTPILTRPIFGASVLQRALGQLDRRNMTATGSLARLAAGYLVVAKKHRSQASIRRARKRLLTPNIGAVAGNTASFER